MRQAAVFAGISLLVFLGLLALLVALALAEGHGLISCRDDCSPSSPLLGENPQWRMILIIAAALVAGAVAVLRYEPARD